VPLSPVRVYKGDFLFFLSPFSASVDMYLAEELNARLRLAEERRRGALMLSMVCARLMRE
jgi:hypothetical protein